MGILFLYGLALGAGFVTGVYAIEMLFAGLKSLIGRYVHIG